MSGDPYVYPGTSVLRNALDIRDPERLRAVEADLTALRAQRLAEHGLPGRYDLAHLRAFHRALFEGLYDWAGELRTVAIAKTDLFCLPQHLERYGAAIFNRLARARYLTGRDRQAFVEGLAEFLGDVNALHPFREGNGRAQRAFVGQLARDAGYDLHWERADPARNVEASIASMRGDPRALHELLHDITEPRPAGAPTGQAPTTARAVEESELAEVQRLLQAGFPAPHGSRPTGQRAARPRPARGPEASADPER